MKDPTKPITGIIDIGFIAFWLSTKRIIASMRYKKALINNGCQPKPNIKLPPRKGMP